MAHVGLPDDQLSFDDAFPDLITRAYRLAYRMLGDRAAAEDVAADALAVTLARWHRVAALPHRTAWVLRVTTNLALRASKRSRRAAPAAEPTAGVDAGFEHDAAVRVALVAALRSLPKRQREAIVLRYISGLDERDVAGILGVSPGTVKTHLHRGALALRNRLGSDFREEGGLVVAVD